MPRGSAESRATIVGKWLLALLVPASALALGSLQTHVLMVMSAAAALACGLLWSDCDVRTSRASHWVLAALVVLLGMTVLQALPLPAGLSRAVSPTTADIWDRALAPLREPGPSWHPLSLAPGATRVEVLRGFFYACVFLAGLRVATLEHGERLLIQVIIFSTVVMALSALAHTAFDAEMVFGLYRPRELQAYRPGRLAPLLNTNHLAAYLDIGACVSLWALLTRRAMPRPLSASTTLLLVATSVWQGSRGGVGALCFGLLLTLALTLFSRRRFESTRAGAAILAACALVATLILSISFSDVARVHLVSGDLTKLEIAKSALSLVRSSPWFGVGRGGFETVFSSVHPRTTYSTFTNPEDILIQWTLEWGLPVSLAGLGMLGWALRPQVLLRAVRPATGVWVAMVAALLHELVDYHFEVPGVVALVAICAAIVVNNRSSSRESRRPETTSFARYAAGAAALGSLVAIAAAWPLVGHSLAEERRRFSGMAIDKAVSAEEFREEIRASMLRYPAEPFLPLMGAVRAQVNDEGSVVPWVARALERSPDFGRAHFVLARSLARGHAAQARLEYRLAYQNDERLRDAIVKEAMPIVVDAQTALELVPPGAAGVDMLEAMVGALATRLPATAVMLDEEIERRAPGAIAPSRRRAEASVVDAVNGAAWCVGRNQCLTDALAAAEDLARRDPARCHPHLLVARVRVAMNEVTAALDGLERATDGVVDRAECRRELVTLALQNGQGRRAELVIEQLVRGGCGATADCLALYGWAATMEEGRGHYLAAVRLYRRVLEMTPERDDLLERIGELGVHAGLLSEGLDAYGTLAARHPTDPRWPARIAALRSARTHAPSRAPVPAP